VLILDEPTNHLDLESREALEDALSAFRGSLILVSHDRALLDAVGTRTIAVEAGTLHSYVGGWPEYLRVREERKAAGEQPPPRPRRRAAGTAAGARGPEADAVGSAAGAPGSTAGAAGARRARAGEAYERPADGRPKGKPSPPAGPSKNRLRAQEQAERAVEAAEAALVALEQELADPAAWATKYETAKNQARHTAATRAVEAAYAQLEATL